ncbi:Hypoticical protein [Pectobacterium parmentieri]|uniref:Hypoticical protein n=1 Tax=Pectobacterium parmentieri TaxID=1905730 RepID=A0A0H3HWT8_PECPM|nr:Hypoticical protein [Pectobacterium parmentieri]
MSDELYVKFEDLQWFRNNLLEMKKRILSLSCSKFISNFEYWLAENNKDSTDYDIRFFLRRTISF